LWELNWLILDDLRDDDNSALGLACKNGHLDVVRFLCNNDITVENADAPSWEKRIIVNHYKLDPEDLHAKENYAVRMACENGHIDVVEYLWKLGWLNADYLRAKENYAVRLACENGHLDIVKFLFNDYITVVNGEKRRKLDHRKLDAKDLCSRNNSAVIMACENGHQGIVEYLWQLGLLKRGDISMCPGCTSKLDSN
jgi:ankyrin repeat protein